MYHMFYHIKFLRIKYFHLMNALASQCKGCLRYIKVYFRDQIIQIKFNYPVINIILR